MPSSEVRDAASVTYTRPATRVRITNVISGSAQYRWHVYKSIREAIDKNEGGLEKFSQGYKYYGLNRGEHEGKKGTWYREWAPGARV